MESKQFEKGMDRKFVVIFVVFILVFLFFIFYLLFGAGNGLSLGSNVKEVSVSGDGGKVYVSLDDDVNDDVASATIVFTDKKGVKYHYVVEDVVDVDEIEIETDKVVSNGTELEDFDDIEKVEVIYEYEEPDVPEEELEVVEVVEDVPDVPVVSAMEISQFGITWTFDEEVESGQFANGDYWVVGPVTIVDISPKSSYYQNQILLEDEGRYPNGRIMHGSMINPEPSESLHGFDNYLGYYPDKFIYDFRDDLNVARPNGRDLSSDNLLVVPAGSSLVSTISRTIQELEDSQSRKSQVKTAAILTVLDAPAPVGSFRPYYTGSDKEIKFNVNDVDLSILQNLEITEDIREKIMYSYGNAYLLGFRENLEFSHVLEAHGRNYQRPWLDFFTTSVANKVHPAENIPGAGYGRDIGRSSSAFILVLNLDLASEGIDKGEHVNSLIQTGIDLAGAYNDGMYWYHDGGIFTGRILPIIFAGAMLDDEYMKNAGNWNFLSVINCYEKGYVEMSAFQEQSQTFYVSQQDVDITNGDDWSPDPRSPALPYESSDIGLPDWGLRHFCDSRPDNKHVEASYRSVNSGPVIGTALVLQIMNLKEEFNHDAFFDYADRLYSIRKGNSGINDATETARAIWREYREDYGCVWTRYDSSDDYSMGSCV